MTNIYGIPNCDTVKRTMQWLKKNEIEYHFHNYKTEGISAKKIKEWLLHFPLEIVINKKSSTWRGLNDDEKKMADKKTTAIVLLQQNTSLIKRPIVEVEDKLLVGFDEDEYAKAFHSVK